jgi:hypothetical protein
MKKLLEKRETAGAYMHIAISERFKLDFQPIEFEIARIVAFRELTASHRF